jgi:monofunctional biosynthetic peptidoglycan transglycosylase
MPAARKGRRRARTRTWFRRIFFGLVVLGAIPALLTFVYAPRFVHPISTLMLEDLVTFDGYDRRWVRLDQVAPVLVHSVIMSEDGQFCYHRGVDWAELNAVIDDALAGEGIRGASTITMQTVKNLYLWQRPLGSIRKLVEVPLAIYFDAVLSKRRIMEIYLNIAEWGPGVYGIEAAAQYHFGKPAKDLTARQAALLAVTLPNPADRDPAHPGPGLKRLASIIQRRAANAGTHVSCVK